MARGEHALFNVRDPRSASTVSDPSRSRPRCGWTSSASTWSSVRTCAACTARQREWRRTRLRLRELGFKRFGSLEVEGETYGLFVLDMGPGSVDGWLAGLVAAELGIERDETSSTSTPMNWCSTDAG